jgi:hypothetical protein
LPQTPTGSERDAFLLNQWLADVRTAQGIWFEALQFSGLYDIAQTIWPRVAAIALCALVCPRLLDRTLRIAERGGSWQANDETRMRVSDTAPAFESMRDALAQRRYRVGVTDGTLRATRAPLAEGLSILLHLGALALALGLLTNIVFGWDVSKQVLSTGTAASIQNTLPITMRGAADTLDSAEFTIGQDATPRTLRKAETLGAGSATITLRDLLPGYRVSATGVDGVSLAIRTSNYRTPEDDARVSFGPERQTSLAIPSAQLVVTLLQGEGGAPSQYQASRIGTAANLASGSIDTTVRIGDTTLSFTPDVGASIDARNRPGNALSLFGAALALLGILGSLLLPMRRLLVIRQGAWTEIYASGRNVRRDVLALLSVDKRTPIQSAAAAQPGENGQPGTGGA